MITQEQLSKLVPSSNISGVLLVKDYSIQLTKNGKEYVTGTVQSGIDIQFKAWSQSVAFSKMKAEDYRGIPSFISGTVDSYNDVISIIVDSVQAVEGYTADQFLPIKYNEQAYWDAVKKIITDKVSENGLDLCNKILFDNNDLANRFRVEFAAKSFHDNCKNGLLAHTYKVLSNVNFLMSQYKLANKGTDELNQNYKDLIYIGALLHDIGKTVEMNFGVYQPLSYVTHRYLGIEFISPFKDEIVSKYDEDWYYQLISIMLQHHGEFEEPCRTVAAYIIHKADVLDADMTLLQDKLSDLSIDNKVKINSSYLTY